MASFFSTCIFHRFDLLSVGDFSIAFDFPKMNGLKVEFLPFSSTKQRKRTQPTVECVVFTVI